MISDSKGQFGRAIFVAFVCFCSKRRRSSSSPSHFPPFPVRSGGRKPCKTDPPPPKPCSAPASPGGAARLTLPTWKPTASWRGPGSCIRFQASPVVRSICSAGRIWDGEEVGRHRLDLLVEDTIVVDLKAIKNLEDVHFSVVRSQLKAVGRQHGLLLNFAKMTLEPKRVFAP
jgi:hypothetical protein